jgi:plastocyanin
MKIRSVFPAVIVSIISLTACGGSGSTSPTTPVDADVVVTAIDGIKWDKADYTATAGEIVIAAKNDSSLPHNLHIIDPDGVELSTNMTIASKGDVKSATITVVAGTYKLICTVPGHSNMKSTLTVS